MPSPPPSTTDRPYLQSQPGSRAWPARIMQATSRFIASHEALFLALLLLAVLARAIVDSLQKPLWFDELFTVIVAMQPTAAKFLTALAPSGIGPLQPLLVRPLVLLFGPTELAVRIPSLIAFCAALAGVYIFVRRECGPLFALAAVILTIAEPGWTYAFEARPYAMLLAFMMLGLLSWQTYIRAATGPSRRWALTGIAAALILSILSHHIGLVELGLPLLAGEAVRTFRRRLDLPLLSVATLSALAALAITLPMAIRTRRLLLLASVAFHARLSWRQEIRTDLANANLSLWLIVSGEVLCGATFIAILAFLLHRSRGVPAASAAPAPQGRAMVLPEFIAVALAAALLIPVTMVLTQSAAGYYNCRYGIGSIIGVALLAVFLAWRSDGSTRPVVLVTILFFGGIWLRTALGELHHYVPPQRDPAYNDTSARPVAVTNALYFVPLWWYAPSDFRHRLVYMNNRDDNTVVQICVQSVAPLLGLQVQDQKQFIATNSDFLLLPGPPAPQLRRQIAQANATVTELKGTPFTEVQQPIPAPASPPHPRP